MGLSAHTEPKPFAKNSYAQCMKGSRLLVLPTRIALVCLPSGTQATESFNLDFWTKTTTQATYISSEIWDCGKTVQGPWISCWNVETKIFFLKKITQKIFAGNPTSHFRSFLRLTQLLKLLQWLLLWRWCHQLLITPNDRHCGPSLRRSDQREWVHNWGASCRFE